MTVLFLPAQRPKLQGKNNDLKRFHVDFWERIVYNKIDIKSMFEIWKIVHLLQKQMRIKPIIIRKRECYEQKIPSVHSSGY